MLETVVGIVIVLGAFFTGLTVHRYFRHKWWMTEHDKCGDVSIREMQSAFGNLAACMKNIMKEVSKMDL